MVRHHQHVVGQQYGFRDAVGHHKDGDRHRPPDPQQLLAHALTGQRVQRAKRFVHEEQVRFVDQRPGQSHPLRHAAGKLRRVTLFKPL